MEQWLGRVPWNEEVFFEVGKSLIVDIVHFIKDSFTHAKYSITKFE